MEDEANNNSTFAKSQNPLESGSCRRTKKNRLFPTDDNIKNFDSIFDFFVYFYQIFFTIKTKIKIKTKVNRMNGS